MKNLSDYIDSFGMVVTADAKDGGDSCAHGCAILYAANILEDHDTEAKLNVYTSKLELDSGLYCRHPDPSMWYSRNNTFSRDQLTPLIALLSIRGMRAPLRRLFYAHLKRLLLFAWNTKQVNSYPDEHTGVSYVSKVPDLTIFDTWGMYIRGFDLRILYPLLFICDVPTLIGSIIYRLKLSSSTIQMNHIIMVDFSTRSMPTPIALLAKKVYGKDTPLDALESSWGTWWQPPINKYLGQLIKETW